MLTYRVSGPNARFISSYTRCGLTGTSSKWVRRCMLARRWRHCSTQAARSGSRPWRSRATSTSSSSAARASETIP